MHVKVIIFNFNQCTTFDFTKNWNGYLFLHYQLKIPYFHGLFDIHKVLLSLIWSQITDFGLWFDPKNWQTSQRSDYKKHSVPLHFFYVFFYRHVILTIFKILLVSFHVSWFDTKILIDFQPNFANGMFLNIFSNTMVPLSSLDLD